MTSHYSKSSGKSEVSDSTASATSGGNSRRKTSGPGNSSKGVSSSSGSSSSALRSITNLPDLIERFGSEDKCHEYLTALRWPDGPRCPRCEAEGEPADKVSRIVARRQFQCESCRYQFSVRVGTVFQDSKLPLWKWFLATYIIGESKKGVSAHQLSRMLNVTKKTGWFLCHRIRAAMRDDDAALLNGTVEIDETWIGGKVRGRGVQAAIDNKTIVAGAVARGGDVRLRIIKSRDGKALGDFIRSTVSDDAPAVYTDDWKAYQRAGIVDEDTRHETVNHSAEEWVRGDVHTNTAESVWSLMKRSIIGSYHQLSVKHLPAYLDEMAFRFNNRENPYLFRDTLLALVGSDRLTYKTLIARSDG